MGIWGGGKEVEAAVVSDERRWKEVGVEARRSESRIVDAGYIKTSAFRSRFGRDFDPHTPPKRRR